jgi:hypothetical protein
MSLYKIMTSHNQIQLPRLIAVTGQEGSGKDSYGEHVAGLGYLHVSAGDVLREKARAEGYTDPIPRAALSQVGDRLKQEFGAGPIALSSLRRYEASTDQYPSGLVISGLRRVEEVSAFKEHGAVALWIGATILRRFVNQGARARDDRQTLEEFTERSGIEYSGTTDGGSGGVNLQAVEALADCQVTNSGTLQELFTSADQALAGFLLERA